MNIQAGHLISVPVLLPLVTGALLLLINERRRLLRGTLTTASLLILLIVALFLLQDIHSSGTKTVVYLLGDWPPPFAIVLVLDRLAALMVMLTALLALPIFIFSLARWHREGAHFHTLFLLLLMGINGAFLTGDLFNLFVFFEVMLAASYGLALHAPNPLRVRTSLHYIVINLATALFFLIGVSLLYGVSGTLNMADLAQRIPDITGTERTLLEVGAAILGVVFLVKAGMWPLGFWLPATYAAAVAPVAAMFAILSKVGVYVLMRLSLLFFGEHTGDPNGFGSQFILIGGVATLLFGMIGILAAQTLGQIAGSSILLSSGTLLAVFSFNNLEITTGALFYLTSSTLTISLFFLLIELAERSQSTAANILAVTREAFGETEIEEEKEEAGVPIPGTLAILGIVFSICALLLAGLPPLSGFIAKFIILTALITVAGDSFISMAWWLVFLLMLSGLAALITLSRMGIRIFWSPVELVIPRVRIVEFLSIAALLCLIVILTIQAELILQFMDLTAQSLYFPKDYIDSVMSTEMMRPFTDKVTP